MTHRLYHLARADFLERVRRHGFLVALLFSVFAAYGFLPPNPSNYVTLVMGNYRGIYNSEWIGTAVAMLCGAFISMIGFYVVKNAVERDRRTGVGQILATTPISRVQYTLGKTLSNFAVLASMAGVVALSCVVMQFVRGEDSSFNPLAMFTPFVLLTLPILLLTSAVAVFSETMPVLRGGFGNIAFVILWGVLLGNNIGNDAMHPVNDPIGAGIALPGMFEAAHRAFPDFDPSDTGFSMGINVNEKGWTLSTFTWNGIHWTGQYLWWRLTWVLAALGVAVVAAIPFDRFDTAAKERKSRRPFPILRRFGELAPSRTTRSSASSRTASLPVVSWEPAAKCSPASVRDVARDEAARSASSISSLFVMVMAEWKLIVRRLRWFWIGPLGFGIAALTAPVDAVRSVILPLVWFWPVLQWSKLGTREATYNTEPIFFSTPRPLSRQLFATWIAGVMLAVVAAFPVALRFAITGQGDALFAWCVGAAFIPALAIALGTWTLSGKAFEAIYTALCYAILQSAAPIDFMGAVASAPRSNPFVYALLTLLLLLAALSGRHRRLRN